MNTWIIIALIFSLLVSAYSVHRYYEVAVSQHTRALLIGLRLAFIGLILIAFIEPCIHFERLPNSTSIPVFFDNSKSMQLFNPESSIVPFRQKLESINSVHPNRKIKFKFFQFGDSLREFKTQNGIHSDFRSIFSGTHNFKNIVNATTWIIVSDGNWTNIVNTALLSENRTIYFLKLPTATVAPSITLSVHAPETHSSDSTLNVDCFIEGFVNKHSEVSLYCHVQHELMDKQTITLDSGMISTNITLKINKIQAGTNCIRISAMLGDSLVAQYRQIVKVNPGILTYSSRSTSPSLDNRFILLAAGSNPSFKKISSTTDSLDLLIVTKVDNDLKKSLSRLKTRGIILFAGCIPCSSSTYHQTSSLIINTSMYSPLANIASDAVPAVRILKNNCSNLSAHTIYAWSIVKDNQIVDSIPVLFVSMYSDKKVLIFTINEYWKWDFIPLISKQDEEGSFSFSRTVIQTAKELIFQNISEQYLAIPGNNLTDADSITLFHFLPNGFEGSGTPSTSVSLRDKTGKTIFDTTFSIKSPKSGFNSFLLPPFQAGKYVYSASVQNGTRSYFYEDTLSITRDNREYTVRAQNEQLLREIGRPLELKDSSILSLMLDNKNSRFQPPIKETLRISRNWFLLLLILIVFGTELIIRRKAGLL